MPLKKAMRFVALGIGMALVSVVSLALTFAMSALLNIGR